MVSKTNTQRGTVLCCDCNRHVPRVKAVSADPSDPLTGEDKTRIGLVGPIRGLFVCADRATCKQTVERKRYTNFLLACKATKSFRTA